MYSVYNIQIGILQQILVKFGLLKTVIWEHLLREM